jgi:predicted nucleic acid-binding protein
MTVVRRSGFAANHIIGAPDFLFIECRNVLLTKVRRGDLDHSQAEDAEIALAAVAGELVILASSPKLSRALAIALDLAEPIYDCIYLAAALATDRKLITADAQFVRKASIRFGQDRVELLQ